MTDEIRFKYLENVSPKQMELHSSYAKTILYGGAMGGGKTWAGLHECIMYAILFAGSVVLVGRKAGVDLLRTTLEEFKLLLPPGIARIKKNPLICEFKNGSTIVFLDCEDPNKWRSYNANMVFLDEAHEIPETIYNMAKTRIGRRRLPDGTIPVERMVITCNPGPGWIKRDFYQRHIAGDLPEEHQFIQALPTDNMNLGDGYVDRLREELPEAWVDRFVEGNWDAFEGQVFPEFDVRTHVQKAFTPPSHWKRYRGMDWGFRNPCGVLWAAREPGGRIFIYAEHKKNGLSPAQQSTYIKAKETGYSYVIDVADPSIVNKTKGNESVFSDFQEAGIVWQLGDNSVQTGLFRVSRYLEKRSDGLPGLVIMNNCPKLIEEMVGYQWEDYADSDVKASKEEVKKVNDHLIDPLRYLVMAMPELVPEEKGPEEWTLDWYDKQEERMKFERLNRL